MDENGLQFFNLIDQNAVGCWNSMLPYAPINQAIVARHDEAIIFPADIKVRVTFALLDIRQLCLSIICTNFIYFLLLVGVSRLTLDYVRSDADFLVVDLKLHRCKLQNTHHVSA